MTMFCAIYLDADVGRVHKQLQDSIHIAHVTCHRKAGHRFRPSYVERRETSSGMKKSLVPMTYVVLTTISSF